MSDGIVEEGAALTPEVCLECKYFHEAKRPWPHEGAVHECRFRAPLFTVHFRHGMFPSVNRHDKSCGDAVARDDIASIRKEREEAALVYSMRRCPCCHNDPREWTGGHASVGGNADEDGWTIWCAWCNTYARGETFADAIRAWNRGDVANDYDEFGEDG